MHRASVKLLSRLFVLFWADQVAKLFIRELMDPYQSLQILPFLHIEFIRNQGIAFGMLEGHTAAIILVSSLVVALLVLAAIVIRHDSRWMWPFALLGAGSIGNLVDRVWYGSVTDFIRLPHWPAFNFADVFIVVGVMLLARAMLWSPEQRPETGYWYEDEDGWEAEAPDLWPDEDAWGQQMEAPEAEGKPAAAASPVSS